MKQPIDLRPDHAKIVHEIIARHLPAGVSVRVFGSRAKWAAKPYSDLDLALKGKKSLPRPVLADLAEAFSESDLPFRVDVVDWHAVAPSFQAVIDRDGVALPWPFRSLGELTVNFDNKRKPVKEADRRPGPYPYYGASGVVDYVDSYLIDGDFLLIAEDGENLRTRQTPIAFMARGKSWVNNHAHIVTGNDQAETIFINYALQITDISGYLTGAVMPKLTQGNLNKIQICCPDINEQRSIISVLAALDDKIELNRRMNETLEAMAQAIFRDWFVDFGPTRRKMAGETDPVAIMGGITTDHAEAARLAALFPDALGEDDLPVGWAEKPLDAIAEFLNGLALQKYPAVPGEPDFPVIKIAELRNGLSERTDRASRDLPAKYIVRNGDFLFSWSGSLLAKVWTEDDGALNQHLFKVTSDTYPQWFYALWVQHHIPEFQQIAASKATTMGHIQRGHLAAAMTVCPPEWVIDHLAATIEPLWDRLLKNEFENRTLAETRDYLLPRLMSGEVRVQPTAEAA